MKLVKSKHWTRKSDVIYWFWRMPLNIIKTIPYILIDEPKINEMTWHDYIGLAQAMADCQCGRMWMEEKEASE